jgi:hypothetical protein
MATQQPLPKISKATSAPMKFNIISSPPSTTPPPKTTILTSKPTLSKLTPSTILKNESSTPSKILKNESSTPSKILKNESSTPSTMKKDNSLTPVLPKIATPSKRKIVEPKIATPARVKNFTMISNDLQKVPTTSIIPPKTPRTLQKEKPIVIEVDPMMNASIYLNTGNDTKNVSSHMKSLSKNIKGLQQQYKNVLKPVPSEHGLVTKQKFEEFLSIYENNQVYYQEEIDDKTMDMEFIKRKLTELEHWFIAVIEPRPHDDVEAWRHRENSKLIKGYSPYCDPELYTYIKQAPLDLLSLVKRYHVIHLQ